MTVLAAEEIRRFGIEPKAALLSHSNFGSRDSPSALKMREAAGDPEAHRAGPDQSTARCTAIRRCRRSLRKRVYPHSTLKGEANLLVFPNLDSANIALTIAQDDARTRCMSGRSCSAPTSRPTS